MLKKFIADIAFIQILNLLVKPIWILIIDREVQNQLSQAAYGEYFALYNFSLLFFIVLDLGITSFNSTQISKDRKKLKQLFGNLFGLKILLAALYVFIVFSLGSVMGYTSSSFKLLVLLAFIQIISSFNQYFRSSISAFQLFKSDGVFMVLDRLIIIILCSLMLWGGIQDWQISIERFAWAQLVGLSAVALLLVAFIYKKLDRISLSFSLKKVFPLLKKTWPFGLLVALMGLYNYTDGVMIEKLATGGAEETGLYAMGYRLFFAVFMFAQIFSNVLLPLYGKYEKDKANTQLLSTFTAKLLVLTAIALSLISFVYQTEIIEYLYPQKYSNEASETFAILMFSFIGSAFILVYGTLLTAREKLKQLNITAFITLVLNLSLNYTLIPQYGAKGAAIATLISQLIFGLSCFVIAKYKLRFHYSTEEVLRFLIAVVMLFVGILISKQYLDNYAVHLVMITLTILIAALISKILDLKKLKSNPSK